MSKVSRWRAVAGLLGTVGALVLPAAAQAEFTSPYTTRCSGGETAGITTGVQANLEGRWASDFELEDHTSPLSCAGSGSIVLTEIATSPEVLGAFGSVGGTRNPEFTLGAGEEPPTLAQWLSIDVGDKPLSDSGIIRQIPSAVAAVVPLVNYPAGCAIPAKEATADGRFTVSNSQLEKVYAGEIATWGELLPDIEASCASIPLKRVVPEGTEGSAFVFKQWLSTVNASRGWSSLANSAWPNDSGATATVRASGGDRAEVRLVARTSGSIGFGGLANSRIEEFGFFSPENLFHKHGNTLFWLSAQNGAGEQVEPTRDPNSGKDNVKGANCDNPTFNYVPSGYDTTATPIWRYVTAAGSKTGWPICTLTYNLAWDDASTVYGNTEAQQAKQRTVKDFLAYVVGSAGQEIAKERDYSALPAALLADAQDGQSRVGWNKVPGSKEAIASAIKSAISTAEEHVRP